MRFESSCASIQRFSEPSSTSRASKQNKPTQRSCRGCVSSSWAQTTLPWCEILMSKGAWEVFCQGAYPELIPWPKIKPFASQCWDPSSIPKQQLITQLKNYRLKGHQDVSPETHPGEKSDRLFSPEVICFMLWTKQPFCSWAPPSPRWNGGSHQSKQTRRNHRIKEEIVFPKQMGMCDLWQWGRRVFCSFSMRNI